MRKLVVEPLACTQLHKWGCCAESVAALQAWAQARVFGQLRAAVMSIAQEQGPTGYYAGLVPNLAQVLPSAALSYFVFEACKRALHVRE